MKAAHELLIKHIFDLSILIKLVNDIVFKMLHIKLHLAGTEDEVKDGINYKVYSIPRNIYIHVFLYGALAI